MSILRKYQEKAKANILGILYKFQVCYLAGELRTGKTLVALSVASVFVKSNGYVLFITKKKVIPSVRSDYDKLNQMYNIEITNYESIEKTINKYITLPSFIIYDEAHTIGAFPKPSKRTKIIRNKLARIPSILLSGTPTPESYSQLYHQFWATGLGPWVQYKTFYQWAGVYVIPRRVYIRAGLQVTNYATTKPTVIQEFDQYRVSMTQKEAGFDGEVIEHIHTIQLPRKCVDMIKSLRKSGLFGSKLITDTAQAKMQSIHQISSGTYIDSEHSRHIISRFKVEYIKRHFKNKKMVIFYVYIAEGDLLKNEFPNWTDDPDIFNNDNSKIFICQVVSGREGINLNTADDLIFYNISFSAVSYWQARARSQSIDGGNKNIHWLFSDKGMEKRIYDVVLGKKNFTTRHFNERDYN